MAALIPGWGPSLRTFRESDPRTLAGQTAQRLRNDIVRHRFVPGERLPFDKLSKLYDVGTSPLREALFQVVAQGLVVAEDHKGFVVAPIDFGEMLDVSSLRAHLETFAIRESIRRADADWEVDLLGAFHRMKRVGQRLSGNVDDRETQDEWEQRHREFHFSLCKGCGSPWLLHFFEELYDQLERYRRYYWRYSDRVDGADSDHEAIMQAAIGREEEKAVALLQEHFSRQAQLTMRLRQSLNEVSAA